MFDIGIDLGTATTIVYVYGEGIKLNEPSVVAINTKTNKVVSVGEDAYKMIGKTPSHIKAIMPLENGVVSDYKVAQEMVKYFVKKICGNTVVKPRIAICVPSGITNVESEAVIQAALFAGARKVYLLEEPVAAAIGAGVDIARPNGNMIVDIGGGTTDIAVMSLSGISVKTSIRVAGNTFNRAIVKYIRDKYALLIGDRMADNIKREIGSVYYDEDKEYLAKGRNLLTGMPSKQVIKRSELYPMMVDIAKTIYSQIPTVLSQTPPELTSDVLDNGIIMTGGGALLDGLSQLVSINTGIKTVVAENSEDCVAIGTGRSFDYLGKLVDGFITPSTYQYK